MTNLSLTVDDAGVAQLVFDRPNSPANIFDQETLDELEHALDQIEKLKSIKQLVISSAKPGIFIAGADIKSIARATTEELGVFLKRGQDLFDRIAALPCGTAAAIHGACLGGGYELALACEVRVASPDAVTQIGLPETQLGIIPAWGGSTRFPKLIGIQKALPLILAGKTMAPSHARKLGAIDDVVPRERLVERCLQLLEERPKRKSFGLQNSLPGTILAGFLAKKGLKKRTRGHYPALLKAIETATGALRRTHANSLKAERVAAMDLAGGETARQLLRLFFLTEKSKKSTAADQVKIAEIKHTAVIGAGVMGAGIAHWIASRKIPVLLKDLDEAAVARGMQTIQQRFAEAVSSRIFSKGDAARRFHLVAPAASPVPMPQIDLVIEAAVENMAVKKKIFADLATRTRPEAILATNTSALSISELAGSVPNPERVVGLHFFNPVHRMKLVEIVYTEKTRPEVTEACLNFVRKLGKSPVLVKDSPGFLVNRILMPYLIEAGRFFEQGIDPKKIDEAMLDFGMPVGPVQLLDDIGLDVALHVAETMETFFKERMRVPAVFKQMVAAGILGRKKKKGIFRYDQAGKGQVNRAATAFVTGTRNMPATEIADRLALLMVAESYRCLEEGIVNSADDIDFAMIMGTGWAPFRGGPMAYARSIGEVNVGQKLSEFEKVDGIAYLVPDLLVKKSF
jgi:3-hydroxyacyl-CoA dehydrogenase / enoyl-CoA hydratase / 3-hydroxybutyryl-CoA epimerase